MLWEANVFDWSGHHMGRTGGSGVEVTVGGACPLGRAWANYPGFVNKTSATPARLTYLALRSVATDEYLGAARS